MLSDVEDGGGFEGFTELRLINLALNLMVVLEVCLAVIDAFKEGIFFYEVAGGEFRWDCIQPAWPEWDYRSIPIDVLIDAVLLLDLDGLHESPILAPVVAISVTEYVYLSPFYNINALLTWRLQQSLIGKVECLLQLAGNACLHIFWPSA